jgi:hypothetical protein
MRRTGGSAIDGRTTRHPGYALSQRKRKLIEQAFDWLKTVAFFPKLRHRGGRLVDWLFSFGARCLQPGTLAQPPRAARDADHAEQIPIIAMNASPSITKQIGC